MILVDTSVWVAHLRTGDAQLERLLQDGEVLCHPFVVGELACGQIHNRCEILSLLRALPMGTVAEHEEILQFIETHRLMGLGLGLIDVHLLAAARLAQVPLWTFDRRLDAATRSVEVEYR
jgi:predicted nucleic acid-binding protein